jgi:hypothetical protein
LLANQHASICILMENHVRIYRENPIAWVEKPILRFLRKKYGKDKRLFVSLRGVYLALCEMDSDFTDTPITFFTETVGTYAGVSREVAGKCINLLIKDGLITKTRVQDEKTNKYLTGTYIQIKSFKNVPAISEPLPGIASNGDRQQRGSRAVLKKITNDKKISHTFNNVRQSPIKNEDKDKVEYYAKQLADKLNDRKSLSFYRIVCARYNPNTLLKKAAEIVGDGGARNPGAVFAHWIKTLQVN